MTRFLIIASTLVTLLSNVTTACDKLPENGDLDGKWRLEHIYSKPTASENSYTVHTDKRNEGIYWSFQLKLLSITTMQGSLNGHTGETIARFVYEGRELDITQTYIHYRDRDSLLTDPATNCLEAVGIRGNASRFTICTLDSRRMTLRSDMDSLIFRKI